MNNIIHLETITDLHKLIPQSQVKHPLIKIIDFTKFDGKFDSGMKISSGFYTIMFKNYCVNKLKYGQKNYDFQEGSLICIAPRQIISLDEKVEKKDNAIGWGSIFSS